MEKSPITQIPIAPFYVGKGCGDRVNTHNRNRAYNKVVRDLGKDNITKFKVAGSLTEIEALILEAKLIDVFGTVTEEGTLVNLDLGKRKSREKLYDVCVPAMKRPRNKWGDNRIDLFKSAILNP